MARNTGSAGVSEQGKGTGGVTRKPERSRLCPHESSRLGAPAENNAPGLMTDLANIRSADANTKLQGMRNPEAKP